MDINQLIADMQEISQKNSISLYKRDRCASAATALATLQAENEKLRAELEQVTQERDAVKSPEVLEAVDELMEFARARMSTGNWLYYVEVLGEWRGQKED